ncbi:MAG: hypothetical protein RIA63_02455 [Cyclobacteriaceae bacterium]
MVWKKNVDAGYKLVVTGNIEKLEIRRGSAKITYELIENGRVRIEEDSLATKRSYEGPITPPFDEKDPRNYYVKLESKFYELRRPDFFSLKGR